MLTTMVIFLSVFLLSAGLGCLSVSAKADPGCREYATPFECGFDPGATPRLTFSIHFFLIAVLFLVFDLEVILLIPVAAGHSVGPAASAVLFVAVATMMIGVYYEWNAGMLDWES